MTHLNVLNFGWLVHGHKSLPSTDHLLTLKKKSCMASSDIFPGDEPTISQPTVAKLLQIEDIFGTSVLIAALMCFKRQTFLVSKSPWLAMSQIENYLPGLKAYVVISAATVR